MPVHIALIENHIMATLTIRKALTQRLMDEGYIVRVFTTGTHNDMADARSMGFDIIDVGSSNQKPGDIIRYMQALRKGLASFAPSVVLTFTIRPAIWGNLVTRLLGIPTITNITGTGPLFESRHPAYRIARSLYRMALRKTRLLFFQNDEDQRLFIQHGFTNEERTARIAGSGVDTRHFLPMPYPADKTGFLFLFIGRLVKDKGIRELVEASRMLKAKQVRFELMVLGPLWEQNLKENIVSRAELDQWVEEGILRYAGEARDVRPYIAMADCLVLPSYREGTSNVLLEAASMEKPAITCDVPGCRHIVDDGKTGFLCQVADADDLAAAMQKMLALHQDTRTEMGRTARRKVVQFFDKQQVIETYLKAIRSVLNTGS